MVDQLNVSYLYKKRGVYYFSKRIPCDVRSYYKSDRIVICLRTKSNVSAIRASKSLYQKEQLGDAFIDNKILIHKAKQSAFQLAEVNADKDIIEAKAHELVKEHSNEALSTEKLDNLITYIQSQVHKHLKLDRVEASIIDTDDKNVYFMWG